MNIRLLLPIEDFDAVPAPAAAPKPIGCGCARCRNDPGLPQCRADAWEEGHRAGLAARAEITASHSAALESALRTALASADTTIADIAESTAEALGRAVIALVAAALPASFASLGTGEARRIAAAVLPALHHEAEVTITASPGAALLLEPLATRRITVLTDPAAGPGDISLAWRNGRTEHSAAAALARARLVLAELGLLPDPAPAGSPEPAFEELANG